MQNLITAEQAAELLGVTVYQLNKWRAQGDGPAYVRLSNTPTGRVRYRPEDIKAFIAKQRRKP